MESASRTRIIASSVVHMAEQVKSSKQQLITLQGATKWKSFVVTDSELSVHYLGPSANTCAALSFLCNPPTFSLTPQREIFSGHRSVRAKKLVSAASFLNHQIDAVSKELLQTSSLVLSDIGQVFQCLDLRLGRLECTATEIATLKRRYKGKLSHGQDPASKCFQLEINFFDRFDTAKLGAVFAISDQYPFARVDICLNAFVDYLDVEAIHKLLIRSAKPGFGYLSRICDILSTYVH